MTPPDLKADDDLAGATTGTFPKHMRAKCMRLGYTACEGVCMDPAWILSELFEASVRIAKSFMLSAHSTANVVRRRPLSLAAVLHLRPFLILLAC